MNQSNKEKNMIFEQMPLRIPRVNSIRTKGEKITLELRNAKTKEEAFKAVKKSFKLQDDISSDITIIQVRNTIDTNDKVYEKANDKVNEIAPIINEILLQFQKEILNSPFKSDIEEKFGELLIRQMETEMKVFDNKIIDKLVEENKLVTEYDKILASAKIDFRGETLSLTQLAKYMVNKDAQTREDAAKLYYGYYEEHNEEIGNIYDKLVHLRNDMAKELGFKNFVEMGYLRLGRLDYNAQMVKGYRDQIHEVVVPVVKKLRVRQAKRLGIKKPLFLDYNLDFLSGNATPKGDSTFLVEKARKMYHEMGKESGEFFDFMTENHLLDLDAKLGKAGGGYMTYIPRYKSPFIFSNSNGTSADVDTLTHEVGHAFQGYLGSKIKVPSYRMPTLESAEIDSMSMEFFAWDWMDGFFGDDAEKYKFVHLDSSISFLPYGVEVDEFQHIVYENPDLTHEERCQKWKELEAKYRPWVNYKGFDFLLNGGYWMRQHHIFSSPFYYIDYTLAQIIALQFKCELDKNREKAWKKYIKLLKMGGKYTFLELLERAKLRNPFIEGNVKKVIKPQIKVLNSFDDKNM